MRRVVIARDLRQFREAMKLRTRGAARVVWWPTSVVIDTAEYIYPVSPDHLRGMRCLSFETLEGGEYREDYLALVQQLQICNLGCSETTIEPDNEL